MVPAELQALKIEVSAIPATRMRARSASGVRATKDWNPARLARRPALTDQGWTVRSWKFKFQSGTALATDARSGIASALRVPASRDSRTLPRPDKRTQASQASDFDGIEIASPSEDSPHYALRSAREARDPPRWHP